MHVYFGSNMHLLVILKAVSHKRIPVTADHLNFILIQLAAGDRKQPAVPLNYSENCLL